MMQIDPPYCTVYKSCATILLYVQSFGHAWRSAGGGGAVSATQFKCYGSADEVATQLYIQNCKFIECEMDSSIVPDDSCRVENYTDSDEDA